MTISTSHIKWFVNTGKSIVTADGKLVDIWEFQHQPDDEVLSEWARHFRNHYCLDADIDYLRGRLSREDFLSNLKFPSTSSKLGPSVRAGDFGEILVADYLQWILGFDVPRVRWSSKIVRDDSPKGSDLIGFKLNNAHISTNEDSLAIFEVKTKFSASSSDNRLQDAVNDSAKDHLRMDESLNFIKQRLYELRNYEMGKVIERFQSPVDLPYQKIFGAASIYTEEYFDAESISKVDCNKIPKNKNSKEVIEHPYKDQLTLVVIKGSKMMELVHELYRRAANEA